MHMIFANMKMASTYLFFFALLVINITDCAAQNSSQFNQFRLVQTWPHGYCLKFRCIRRAPIFVLHGLWPVDSTGKTLQGTNKADPLVVPELMKDPKFREKMEKYWPSLSKPRQDWKNIWISELKKHSSVAFMRPQDYFKKAVDLIVETDVLGILRNAGIFPNGSSYDKEKYNTAIKARTGHDPILNCVERDGHFQLSEVIMCVDAEAKPNFIPCSPNSEGSCGRAIKFPGPVN